MKKIFFLRALRRSEIEAEEQALNRFGLLKKKNYRVWLVKYVIFPAFRQKLEEMWPLPVAPVTRIIGFDKQAILYRAPCENLERLWHTEVRAMESSAKRLILQYRMNFISVANQQIHLTINLSINQSINLILPRFTLQIGGLKRAANVFAFVVAIARASINTIRRIELWSTTVTLWAARNTSLSLTSQTQERKKRGKCEHSSVSLQSKFLLRFRLRPSR